MKVQTPVPDFAALRAQNPNRGRIVLHADANCFYASVECLYRPELRERPVAVCGDPEARHGIVLTKNYIAKKYGIKTGEALFKAKQKCPELVLLPTHYELYRKFSRKLRRIYESYTERVESYGLDECWLELAGGADIAEGARIADEIRARVSEELGITVSIGVSDNKAFSKLGSDLKKPNATTVVPARGFERVIWPQPVSSLLFVGPRTLEKFMGWGILTIGDLARADANWLASVLGKGGIMLKQFALGLDTTPVSHSDEVLAEKSIGNSTTPPHDLETLDDVKSVVFLLAECVSGRLRRAGFRARTVSLGVRTTDLKWHGCQSTLPTPGNLTQDIAQTALRLFAQRYADLLPLRSLGVNCDGLVAEETPLQMDLLGESARREREERMERAVDALADRFGKSVIHRGAVYADRGFARLDPVDDHIGPAMRKIAT